MPPQLFLLPLLIVLLFFSALISGTEIAIISFNKIRLKHLRNRRVKKAQAVYEIISHLDPFITLILILNNLLNIAITAIITTLFILFFGYRSVTVSIFFVSIIIVIFCEIVPKLYGSKAPDRLSLSVSPYLVVMLRIFKPVIDVFTRIGTFLTDILLRMRHIKPRPRMPLISEEEIKLMIEVGREEGLLGEKEKEMLNRIFQLGRTKVKDIMVPKEHIVMIDVDAIEEDIVAKGMGAAHTRFPVYKGTIDNVVGMIDTRDIIYLSENPHLFVIEDLISDIYKVDGEMTVIELLRNFQKKKTQMAMVLDSKGKVIGMVTIEDLVEEIVGELEEEKLPLK